MFVQDFALSDSFGHIIILILVYQSTVQSVSPNSATLASMVMVTVRLSDLQRVSDALHSGEDVPVQEVCCCVYNEEWCQIIIIILMKLP